MYLIISRDDIGQSPPIRILIMFFDAVQFGYKF